MLTIVSYRVPNVPPCTSSYSKLLRDGYRHAVYNHLPAASEWRLPTVYRWLLYEELAEPSQGLQK